MSADNTPNPIPNDSERPKPVEGFKLLDLPWHKHGVDPTERVDLSALPPESEPKPKFVPLIVTPDETERRRNRLRSAGLKDEALIEQIASGPSFCPPINDHDGSKAATEAIVAFLRDPKMRTLVLAGNRGRGKTYASVYPLAHTSLWDLAAHKECRLMYSSLVRVGEDWDKAIREYERAHVLVIDDLGSEIGDWATAQICALLKNRYDWNRKTIVTTNLAPWFSDLPEQVRAAKAANTIERRYGDTLMSRLSNKASAMCVVCKGYDLRAAHVPGDDL
jgi:DNA replication protein DnaC